MTYVLVIATEFYMIQKERTIEDLKDIVKKTIDDSFYMDKTEDDSIRFIPLARIRLFDILTQENFKKKIEEANKQREGQMRMQDDQSGNLPSAGGGNIIQMPGRGGY